MIELKQYIGICYFMGLVLDVHGRGDQLIAGIPDVPTGFEVLMEPIETNIFRTIGGRTDGSPILLARDPEGEVTKMMVGTYDVQKITPETLASMPVVERLLPPEFKLTPEKQTKFKNLLHTKHMHPRMIMKIWQPNGSILKKCQ